MAQTLNYNSAVTSVAAAVVPTFDDDMNIIQKLDDEPNDVGGLTAAQLKEVFDQAGNQVKDYINNELVPAIISEDLTEQARSNAEAERVANEQERVANEEARQKAEQERVNETTGVVAEARSWAEQAQKAASGGTHAKTHCTSGSDPISPSDIGAQETLKGTKGQIVGFDTSGNAVAQDAPETGAPAVHAAQHAKSGSDPITPAAIGAAATATYTATVTASWTASGNYHYQDITVSGILATDNPVVDINPGSDNAANVLYGEAMCKVFRITTSANKVRVWATEAITTAFPIQLKVVR